MIIDLREDIIMTDPKGNKWKLTTVGKKVLFSYLWRHDYVDKIRDERYVRKED